jgi:DNA-binding NtrC family response regulator
MANAHLLVVDDEPNILTSLSTALRLEGYAVDVAGGVRVAEDKIAKRAYDLLLLDVALPDGDGIDLLTRLRAARNEIPCIVMSGHGTIDAAVRATRLGALDFLEKPLSTDRLLLVLDNTLRLVRAEAEARELKAQAGFDSEILGESTAMKQLRERIVRTAKAKDANVLVVGERGTGKELVARAIHTNSPRVRGPLEKLNCAAVPGELIESELFGHEAGAFTGATKSRRGKFERANGGTLFLDEVGDMPMPMQAKLLRVLQEREIERVGGGDVIKVDVRVVAATNKDLVQCAAAGTFRADLYDRLHVLPIEIPPLRARREDVPMLARHFLDLAGRANDRRGMTMTEDAIAVLSSYPFPGNVRELKNLIERLVILSPDENIDAEQVRSFLPQAAAPLPGGLFRPAVPFRVLVDEAERTIMQEALKHYGGQMAATARGLDLERSHLYKKFRALGLREKTKEDEEPDDKGADSAR